MARSTLGVHQSTPRGIVTAESGFTPARALLDHRRARFAQRLYARPQGGQGPEEILERESTLTARLKEAARAGKGGSAEKQELDVWRQDSGGEEGRGPQDGERVGPAGYKTDGRLPTGERGGGAACVRRSPEGEGGWTGRRFQLGTNKEVFDAEVLAIWQALRVLEQRKESGRSYTIFVDSASAIAKARDDTQGPGQRFGVAAIEVGSRLTAARNEVTIRWVPAHAEAKGNEVADQYAKDAATGRAPREELPEGYAEETSLAHMTRVATEARSKETIEWFTAHV